MNDQRKVIYEQRADIMDADAVDDVVLDMRRDTVNALVGAACPPHSYPEQWDVAGLEQQCREVLGLDVEVGAWIAEDGIDPEHVEERIAALADARMEQKISANDAAVWRQVEKSVLLERLDHYWKEHLATLDALRQVVHLRAYAQKTPLNEYKQEAFALFERMLETIRLDVTRILSTAELQFRSPPEETLPELPDFLTAMHPTDVGDGFAGQFDPAGGGADLLTANPYAGMDLSRNAPCPCGSGRKYKHCHGVAV
jgi:preprotein translocase subunit SecA